MADITWGLNYAWPVLPLVHQAQQATSCSIGNDKFVIAYIYVSTHGADPATYEGRLLVGTVAGTTISYGAEVVFHQPVWPAIMGVCKLEDDKFVVAYTKQVAGVTGNVYARVCTVVGDVITLGAEVDISLERGKQAAICTGLSSSKFAILYGTSVPTRGKISICTVTGATTINRGAPAIFRGGDIHDAVASTKIDTDKLLIATYNTATVATITGTTPSFGADVSFDVEQCNGFVIDCLSASKAILAWNSGGPFNADKHGLVRVLNIAGDVITLGTSLEFEAAAGAGAGPAHRDIVATDSEHFVLAYNRSSLGPNPGVTRYGIVSDTTITSLGDKETWYTPNGRSVGINLIGTRKLVLPFIEGLAGPEMAKVSSVLPVVRPTVTTNPATRS